MNTIELIKYLVGKTIYRVEIYQDNTSVEEIDLELNDGHILCINGLFDHNKQNDNISIRIEDMYKQNI